MSKLKHLPNSHTRTSSGSHFQHDQKHLELYHVNNYKLPKLDRNDPTIRSTLSSFFSEFDNDSGGTLSVIEFVTALRVIGDRLGSEFIHPGPMKLFAELDVDNSGDITLNEFINGVCAAKPQPIHYNLVRILAAVATLEDRNFVNQTREKMSTMNIDQRNQMEKELDDHRSQESQQQLHTIKGLQEQLSAVRTRMSHDEQLKAEANALNEKAAERISELQNALEEYQDYQEEMVALRSQVSDLKLMLNNDNNQNPNENNGNCMDCSEKDKVIRQLQLENRLLKKRLEEIALEKEARDQEASRYNTNVDTKRSESSSDTVSIQAKRERASRNGSTVDFNFSSSSLFQTCSHCHRHVSPLF